MTSMDDVFEFLHNADEQLEKHGNAIEAATKYYEAVYLMRQYMSRIPINHSSRNRAVRDLLLEKIAHYENVASSLLRQETALSPSNDTSHATSSEKSAFSQLSIQNGRNSNKNDARSPLSNGDKVTNNWADHSSLQLSEQRNPYNTLRRQNPTIFSVMDNAELQQLTQQANLILLQAIDGDEKLSENNLASNQTEHKLNSAINVIAKYMEAAELHLKVIQKIQKLKTNSKEQIKYNQIDFAMKNRLQQTLDRVEALKGHQGQSNMSAKNVSASMKRPHENAHAKMSLLTSDEVQVLKQSSLIASGLFLPWSDDDANRLNLECNERRQQKPCAISLSELFTDPDGFLSLSNKQKEHFHAWARPNEIIRIRQQHNNMLSSLKFRGFGNATSTMNNENKIVVMGSSTISPYTIQQKYITDCSFIASLCICANYERKFRKPLVTSILYPQLQDTSTGNILPIYNPNGKYMIKLWLNGIPRCVLIDDYLPIDKQGNLLCSQTTSCTTSNDRLELWVCLIEKAYMKLCGGYNFPGSNSGIDLFSLTGWVPEQIYFASRKVLMNDTSKETPITTSTILRDHETPSERVWERIYSANSYGDCLITVSTLCDANTNEEKVNQVGLVPGHAYAVLSVIQTTNGIRLLQLKNPWAQQSWRGRYSCFDNDGWSNPKLRNEVGYDPLVAKKQDDGVFWICWEDILQFFKDFYLSWNPALFSTCHALHGHWSKSQGPTDDTFNVGENPQYALTLSDRAVHKKAALWILISRHVTKQEQEGEEINDYLTVHIHRHSARKERIWYSGKSGNCILKGCYTNNPHVLVRYDIVDNDDKHLAIVLSQYKKSNDLNYTLSCFCTEDFALSSPEPQLAHHTEISSTWSTYTAGGPIGCDTFDANPQYSIFIPYNNTRPQQSVEIQVCVSSTTTTAINAMLVPVRSYGEKILKASGQPLIDTGNYRHGFVVSNRTSIPPGAYTLVVSNYHAGQTGFYTLNILSNARHIKFEQIK